MNVFIITAIVNPQIPEEREEDPLAALTPEVIWIYVGLSLKL
jgi:hypothetical protein